MFNRNSNLTAAQRANKAVMNIVARLGGCGLLVYFIYKVLTVPPEERPDPTVTTIIAIAFVVVGIVLLFMTISDLVSGLKTGRFKASTYEEADLAEYLEKHGAEANGQEPTEEPQALSEQDKAETKADDEDEKSE